MQIQFKEDSLNRLQAAVRQSGLSMPKEFAAACNATARGMRTPIGVLIRTELAAKAAAVKKVITISRKATAQTLTAGVQVEKTARISLKEFGARQTKTGVSYRISKQGGRKKISNAFIVVKLGGHVLRRIGKARFPIIKLWGASPFGVFVKQKMDDKAVAEADARLEKEIERRIQYNVFKASQLT